MTNQHSHTKTMNRSLLRVACVFFVFVAIGWNVSSYIIEYFLSLSDFTVMTVAPFEMIQTRFSVSVMFAVSCLIPYVCIEGYRFIAPALYVKESKIVKWSTVPLFVMFSVGCVFAMKVFLPIVLIYVNVFYVEGVSNTVTLSNYISFVLSSVLLFGLVFCVPVVLCILAYMGAINHRVMSHYRRHVYAVVLIVGAITTPPDVFTQLLVSVPLIVLYESSIICNYIISLNKEMHQVKVNV